GIILADVVGLGKTVIACLVAKQLKKRGIVICPPGLIGEKNREAGWKKYLEDFGLHDWEVFSRGDLESALKFVKRADDIELVIIDEAHWFRNQDTKSYELLKNICRGKQTILLTATPFNNRPADILSLLKLFITPKKSIITLENNLVDQFKSFEGIFNRLAYIKKNLFSNDQLKRTRAHNYYKALFEEDEIDLQKIKQKTNYLAGQIRNTIESVVIRRNRLDLQEDPRYKDEIKNLSKVEDPKEWFFELTKDQLDFYSEIIGNYFIDPNNGGRFKGAIYRPFEYEKGLNKLDTFDAEENLKKDENRVFLQQRNLFDFMRRLLVKRFESSFGSFEQSIRNFKRITENCLKFIEKTGEFILDRSLLEKIYELDIDEIEDYLKQYEENIVNGQYPKTHKRYKIKNFKNKDQFLKDIKNDINLFSDILKKLSELDLIKNDPKTICLLKNLEIELNKKPEENKPKRKIIIFSEYLDTILYLEKALSKQYGNRMLVISKDLSKSKLEELYKNFDASYKNQEDNYDILLTSDKLSEGFNLNRAGLIINYDIPWNPVRVIQRLGRINRINKKVFEKLYIVNFFPTEKGAELVKSREIAQNKMFLIHNTLGEDSKIFDIDEVPSPAGLYNKIQQNPEKIEKENFYTRAYKEFIKIKDQNPELFEKFKDYPPRIKIAKKGKENELLVFFTKGRLYVCGAKTDTDKINPYYLSFEEVFDKIICSPDEKGLNWNTDKFWEVYNSLKNFKIFKNYPVNEQSLEQKALNNLDFLLKSKNEKLLSYKEFLRTLKEDILFYDTLPDYTLRRIINLKEDSIEEINDLLKDLGSDYLEKEKERIKDQKKELIIAIENKII
ncbi:MAG: helicase-related protein, partial [Patescibacteria group bacterium]|nr:helicase-related protein [Patescibacteria group bacterium]